MNNEFLQTEEAIVAMLKTVYDPEIPVKVYDLGLIYKVDIEEVDIDDQEFNLPGCRFHIGRCTHEGRNGRWGEQRRGKPRLRAGMGQGHDDGGG